MIPKPGCDPEINIVFIGGRILEKLCQGPFMADDLMEKTSKELEVSIDHVILSLDWLYMLSAIKCESEMVEINEVKKS